MKKLLIAISPICVVLVILMGISWGFKSLFVFIIALFFTIAIVIFFVKWAEFVDKHIKD